MTSSLYSLLPSGGNSNNRIIHIIGITGLLLILSITRGNSQQKKFFFENTLTVGADIFKTQPEFKLLPFRKETKIREFNSSKEFQRFHYSDLKLEITMYPNPSTDVVTIDIPEDGILTLSTSSGNVMQQIEVTSGSVQLELNEINEGIYLIQLHTKSENYLKRLSVIH